MKTMNTKKVEVSFGSTVTTVNEYRAALVLEVPLDSTEEEITKFAETLLTADNDKYELDWDGPKDEQEEEEWVSYVDEADDEATPSIVLGRGTDGELVAKTDDSDSGVL